LVYPSWASYYVCTKSHHSRISAHLGIIEYIPQGHRFNILEDVGCFPFTYNTVVGLLFVSAPPIIIGCISAVYAGMFIIFSIRISPFLLASLVMGVMAFNKSRKQYNELLSKTHLTNHRYVRLMCLAGFGSLCTIIIGSYALFRNATVEKVYPWKGWADTHADFSRVDEYPSLIWRNVPGMEGSIELSRWLNVLCAFTFFAFFGFAEEARRNYGSAAKSLARSVGITYTGSFGSSMFNSSGYVQFSISVKFSANTFSQIEVWYDVYRRRRNLARIHTSSNYPQR
jgi:pheromone a factor receptor